MNMSETGAQGGLGGPGMADQQARGLKYPRTRLSDRIEAFVGGVGTVINWIWAVLVVIIVATVGMRYVIAGNTIWIEEVQWHLYSIGFMFALGYAILHDGHVRVDVLATRLRPRTRAFIELLMIVLVLFPMVYLVLLYAIPFVEASYRRGESSSAPGGLGQRWMIKGVIVLAFINIGLAALARLLRVCAYLFGTPRPISHA
jgi:TRAP-type mannitol/chloroaromatic compound transport system permease small subunit